MALSFWILLLLPVILNIKGNLAVLVFLAMNSIICFLMQYAKVQIKIAASVARYEDRMDELKEEGATYEEAFKEYLENTKLDNDETYVPKPIEYAANISLAICIIGIIVGVVRIIKFYGLH